MIARLFNRPAPDLEPPGHRRARLALELRQAQLEQARAIRARHSLRGIRP